MTKKDYIIIAEQFNLQLDNARNHPLIHKYLLSLILDFAEMLEKNNDKFDKKRFLNACGL